jgi:hypothetical protein
MALSTPRILRQGLYLGWAFSAFLMINAILSVREDRQALQTIGKDAAPSVIAAEHIKSALSDMDANAANELLSAPGRASQAVKTAYEDRRKEASKALIAAAENITFGAAERVPIEQIQLALGEYEIRVQQARDYHEAGDPRRDAAYLAATAKMDDVLWPAADALDKANLDVLQDTYRTRRSLASISLVALIFIGVALMSILLAIQVFVFRRTNRVLNLPLVGCTLICLAFLMHAVGILGASMRHLKVAKEDAFTSMHALWRARAVAYRASADESRFLLLHSGGGVFERDFDAQIDSLAKVPDGQSYEQTANRAVAGKKANDFTGYLADELKNITFEGEGEAAKATLIALQDYVARDGQLRALEHAGKHQDAIAQALGGRSGQSHWAFEEFDRGLTKTLAINQKAFDEAVEEGFRALYGFEITALVAGVALCGLLWLGIRPRLREYQL